MVPAQLRAKIVLERLSRIRQMIANIRALPLDSPVEKAIAHGLQEVGVLGPDEAHLLREMAGYRNRLVHFYDEVSMEELYEICTEGLNDIERLTEVLVQWIRTHPERIDEAL